MIHQEPNPRPWTVTALVAWGVLGIFWGAVFDRTLDLADLVVLLLTAVIAWGMWTSRAWAFILMFAAALLSALSLGILLVIRLTQSESITELIPGTIGLVVVLALLLHPATKRFALQSRRATVSPPVETPPDSAPPTLGFRRNTVIALAFLIAAIAIGGVLGVLRIYTMTG